MMFDGTARLHKNGKDIFHFARTASFSEYCVVAQSGVVKVRDDMPLDKACLIGCSVMTGVGAVINTAKVKPGDSVVVIGCGGVGLNVIQGAVLAGAGKIIAVDVLENKLGYALQFGATDVIDASSGDVTSKIHDLTVGGADHAFEAIGNSKTILQAYEATCLGGVTTIVGMAAETDEVAINCLSLPRTEKTIQGSWYGGARPSVDLPRMVDLYMDGKLKVDELVSRTYPFSEINEAYAALDKGEVARSILLF
jgi:S-(hydroxymethyl)glutathione dehydrogenase/alcohol dehydrogenase